MQPAIALGVPTCDSLGQCAYSTQQIEAANASCVEDFHKDAACDRLQLAGAIHCTISPRYPYHLRFCSAFNAGTTFDDPARVIGHVH